MRSNYISPRRKPMKRTPLSKHGKDGRVKDRNIAWREICLWRINFLIAKYGYIKCEYCGKRGSIDSDSPLGVWGHHIDGDRDNCQLSNCYICHHSCHTNDIQGKLEVRQEDFQGAKK